MTIDEAKKIIKTVLFVAEDFEIIVQGEKFTEEKCKEAVEIVTKALDQEPCEDAISREDALMALTGEWTDSTDELIHRFIKRIRTLPPVKPTEKVGQWIDGKCNKCGTHAPYWAMASTYYCSKYCPECGAKMQEVKK